MVREADIKFKIRKKEYTIHGLLAKQIRKAYKEMKKDDDVVILIVGPERVGKSKLRDLIGGYWEHLCGVKFWIDNIHFTTVEYMKFALKQPPFTFVSHDEARRDLNTKRSMAKTAVNFTNYMSECGDNNQVHCLILPAFSDIDKYIALWRVKMVIEVGKKKNSKTKEYERGLFRVIKTKNKKKLAFFHKNKYTKFPRTMVAFTGTFKDNDVIPKDVYKKKKQQFKEVKYIEEEQKETQVVLTPRQIEVISKLKPYSLFADEPKDREILRKLVYSLRKEGFGEKGEHII
jgi:hypothetical protein